MLITLINAEPNKSLMMKLGYIKEFLIFFFKLNMITKKFIQDWKLIEYLYVGNAN